ncbi:MAG: Eco57I restriction-modification methylase domain-containing protein [Phycisphaerales bacterium]|nr:Eco57I restriction-modification methylase domain-containing protein [Phycisphaerales bacterium]
MNTAMHNPDILTCLANLSADEVFTPPKLASAMLDMLPQDLFRSGETTFLDPVCKSGVFLREIARRLNDGLRDQMPDEQKRVDHILTKQVFGLATSELTSAISRRSVYCSKKADGRYSIATKFTTFEGNIRLPRTKHRWSNNGRCEDCGASKGGYERGEAREAYAYPFIHGINPQELFEVQFDVIIGNPPYQLNDGGGTGSSARPIYHLFIEQAKKLSPRLLAMIVPSRWFTGGKGLDDFRQQMLADDRIRYIIDYSDSRDCFPGVDIAGGVNYFLWDRGYHGPCSFTNIHGAHRDVAVRPLNELDTLVRHSTTLSIVRKAKRCASERNLSECVSSRKPFGLDSKVRPRNAGGLTLVSSNGIGLFPKSEVPDGHDLIDTWKVFVSKASSDHGGQADVAGLRKVFARILPAGPGMVCTESYLVIGPYPNERQASNIIAYLTTKTVRYLVAASLFTQNITKDRFAFVPLLPATKAWTDEELYGELRLDADEVAHIENTIRPWGSE